MLLRACESIKYRNNIFHEENQYLNLLEDILSNNSEFVGRNGKTLSIYGSAMHFSLENNKIPLITTKKVAWKTCLKELLWFIKGDTNNKLLKEQNVHIWDANGSREFLDSQGLYNNNEDDLGPIYGFQWRHFNAPYTTCDANYSGKGIDQLEYIISSLKNPETRTCRRLVMSAWNPTQLNEMALPPCHILSQFNVIDGDKLTCSLYQRSGDVGLGVPFNIASYSFLTHLIAKHCGLIATDFYYHLGNCHIYDDHENQLTEQIQRTPFAFPTINIKNIKEKLEDYSLDDIEIFDYVSYENIKMEIIGEVIFVYGCVI